MSAKPAWDVTCDHPGCERTVFCMGYPGLEAARDDIAGWTCRDGRDYCEQHSAGGGEQ